MKKLIIVILCLFTLTGCYNYIELDTLAVVSSILIDYQDNNYKVIVEIYDEDDKVKTFSDEGLSLTEAFNKAEEKSKRKFYYRHINSVLFTKNVDLNDLIYYFFRNPDTNDTFAFVSTNVDDIYKDEDINIGELIKNNVEDDELCSFFEIMKSYVNKTRDLTIPIFDGEKLNGMAVYKNLEKKMEFNFEDEEIIKLLRNKNNGTLHAKCGEKDFILNIDSIKTKYEVDDNIKIDLKLKTSIQEMNCDLDITKTKDLKQLQKYAESSLNKSIDKVMQELKSNEADILGINTVIKNKYKKLDKEFFIYDYKVETDIAIYKKGLLLK